MRALTRRRFLSISAAAVVAGSPAGAAPVRQFHGTALGAKATITLAHPDAAAIARRAFAEIDRLEDIFSLYRAGSALSRLNRTGRLSAPPFELLECLGLCATVHRATGGLFDPTIQPLWDLHARSYAAGAAPNAAEVEAARARTGWQRVRMSPGDVTLEPEMALTLNGIAQGYIADRVAAMLRAEGLREVLVDTGEHHAVGGDWPVTLVTDERRPHGRVDLRDRALATSAPLGTVFDREGTIGHILDPRTGAPAAAKWRSISITATNAAFADALSTALVLMDREATSGALASFADAKLVAAVPGIANT